MNRKIKINDAINAETRFEYYQLQFLKHLKKGLWICFLHIRGSYGSTLLFYSSFYRFSVSAEHTSGKLSRCIRCII